MNIQKVKQELEKAEKIVENVAEEIRKNMESSDTPNLSEEDMEKEFLFMQAMRLLNKIGAMKDFSWRRIEILEDTPIIFKIRTSCACGLPEDSLTVEYYRKHGEVYLYLYNYWYDHLGLDPATPAIIWNLKRFWNRLKMLWKIFVTGKLELYGEFIFEDFNHLRDFIEALKTINAEWKQKSE